MSGGWSCVVVALHLVSGEARRGASVYYDRLSVGLSYLAQFTPRPFNPLILCDVLSWLSGWRCVVNSVLQAVFQPHLLATLVTGKKHSNVLVTK